MPPGLGLPPDARLPTKARPKPSGCRWTSPPREEENVAWAADGLPTARGWVAPEDHRLTLCYRSPSRGVPRAPAVCLPLCGALALCWALGLALGG